MDGSRKIGVVTVTYNSGQVVAKFLECALQQTYRNFVLYVVDNASTDETLASVKSIANDASLKLIANPTNVGFAQASNQGIEAALRADCDAVLLLNNDIEFGSDLFDVLQGALDRYECDMAAPRIMFFSDNRKIWAAGGRFQKWLAYRTVHRGEGEFDDGQFDCPTEVDFSPACCLLIHRSVFEGIGILDSDFFVYAEDADFLYRAKKRGYKLFYEPRATLRHKVSSLTGGGEAAFTIFFGTKNRVYFVLKHQGIWISLPFLLAYQAYMVGSLILRRFSWAQFCMKQRGFLSGVQLRLHRPETMQATRIPPVFE